MYPSTNTQSGSSGSTTLYTTDTSIYYTNTTICVKILIYKAPSSMFDQTYEIYENMKNWSN